MADVRFRISISLDGFTAGPNQSEEHPLGEGGEDLHDWVLSLAAWREAHGREGGEVNPSTEAFEKQNRNVGAQVMGRNMFGGGPGPWPEDPPWEGWWGDEPPFHVPVFVLTHHEREPLTLGDTTYHFVTDGIETAIEAATKAAGEKDVLLAGGAETAQQAIAAGLVDEMHLSLVPILLGSGTRLLDGGVAETVDSFEQVAVVEAPGVTHLTYRPRG
ncbi:MAG TPA: dihydrofolate reductase family protein [Solirubrobacterales bacterium]